MTALPLGDERHGRPANGRRAAAGGLILLAATTMAAGAQALELQWPVACDLGRSCVIQHYVDADPGPAAQDYMCGSVTYQGHNGTDIRLKTMTAQRAGAEVRAAAAGRVLRVRDEAADVSVRETGREGVKGRECGNGLVLAHPDGYETQYCHLARGSLIVKPGDMVAVGQALGRVGLSGDTEFPHLHFTVRHKGEVVDPFAEGATAGACGAGRSLWAAGLQAGLVYRAGEVLNAGFVDQPPSMADVENGAGATALPPDAPALIAFVRAIGLRRGDVQTLAVVGPHGPLATSPDAKPLEANKAQFLIFTGKKRPAEGWPAGEYAATYKVVRDDKTAIEHVFRMRLPSP